MSIPTRREILIYLGDNGIRTFVTASYDPEDGSVNVLFEDDTEIEKASTKLRQHPAVRGVVITARLTRPVLKVMFKQPHGNRTVPAPRIGA